MPFFFIPPKAKELRWSAVLTVLAKTSSADSGSDLSGLGGGSGLTAIDTLLSVRQSVSQLSLLPSSGLSEAAFADIVYEASQLRSNLRDGLKALRERPRVRSDLLTLSETLECYVQKLLVIRAVIEKHIMQPSSPQVESPTSKNDSGSGSGSGFSSRFAKLRLSSKSSSSNLQNQATSKFTWKSGAGLRSSPKKSQAMLLVPAVSGPDETLADGTFIYAAGSDDEYDGRRRKSSDSSSSSGTGEYAIISSSLTSSSSSSKKSSSKSKTSPDGGSLKSKMLLAGKKITRSGPVEYASTDINVELAFTLSAWTSVLCILAHIGTQRPYMIDEQVLHAMREKPPPSREEQDKKRKEALDARSRESSKGLRTALGILNYILEDLLPRITTIQSQSINNVPELSPQFIETWKQIITADLNARAVYEFARLPRSTGPILQRFMLHAHEQYRDCAQSLSKLMSSFPKPDVVTRDTLVHCEEGSLFMKACALRMMAQSTYSTTNGSGNVGGADRNSGGKYAQSVALAKASRSLFAQIASDSSKLHSSDGDSSKVAGKSKATSEYSIPARLAFKQADALYSEYSRVNSMVAYDSAGT
ncbi:hypothetical protein GQ42DRAFT_154349 [Ramicandelaber brevisporus]|nr:hypothetical protein GQ42DRAFT_154349 [Ramicandelaber brevisporus]